MSGLAARPATRNWAPGRTDRLSRLRQTLSFFTPANIMKHGDHTLTPWSMRLGDIEVATTLPLPQIDFISPSLSTKPITPKEASMRFSSSDIVSRSPKLSYSWLRAPPLDTRRSSLP